jgi:hypothetical protein
MDEIIAEVIIQMEDEAASGDARELRNIATALNHLAFALYAPATAVDARLKGNVGDAMKAEEVSEWGIRHAWGTT